MLFKNSVPASKKTTYLHYKNQMINAVKETIAIDT